MRSFATTLLLLAGSAAFAQNPAFEVASIKATTPQETGRFMVRMGGDPGRIDYVNVSLRDLIRQAYDVKDYQVIGPDWMTGARFDVQAKYPPDTPRETRNLMMQALLAERFGLKIHKESKEVQVYNLVVAKGGPKLKKAEDNPSLPPDAPGPRPAVFDRRVEAPGGPAGGGGAIGGVAGSARVGGGGGGGGAPRPGGPGMVMMRMDGPGKMHLEGKGMTVQGFTDMLARQLGKPIFDQTAITGQYDIALDFKPEEGMGMMRGMPMPMPRPEGSGPAPDNVEAPSIFTAVQDQLGLKLESKKGPVETIVVDQASKTPTEN
jgi:uncharacterized protein (TIGR03435 family)